MPDLFRSPESKTRDQRFQNSDTTTPVQTFTPPPEPMLAKNANIPQGHMPVLSSYHLKPSNIRFQMQEEDERVLLFLRKAWIANFRWILLAIVFIFLPFAVFFVRSSLLQINLQLGILVILTLFYYHLVATFVFVNFIIWYYNAAIITNKRIIDIDFHQLLFKDIAETKLELVQDISYQEVGTFQNLFDYGHVLIQTAGTKDTFEFYDLPHPSKIVDLVQSLIGGKWREP